MNAGRLSRSRLAVLTVAVTGLLVAYLVSVPPHLVHHLFDGDGHGQPRCPHLAQSQLSPEVRAEPSATLPLPASPAADLPPADAGACRIAGLTAESPRAPPLL